MFRVGDRVRLASRIDGADLEGTVVGHAEHDVIVRWQTGLETAIASWSLEPVDDDDEAGA